MFCALSNKRQTWPAASIKWNEMMHRKRAKEKQKSNWKKNHTHFSLPTYNFCLDSLSSTVKMIICVCLSFEYQDYPVNGQKLHCLSVNFSSTTTTRFQVFDTVTLGNSRSLFMSFFFEFIFPSVFVRVATHDEHAWLNFQPILKNSPKYIQIDWLRADQRRSSVAFQRINLKSSWAIRFAMRISLSFLFRSAFNELSGCLCVRAFFCFDAHHGKWNMRFWPFISFLCTMLKMFACTIQLATQNN